MEHHASSKAGRMKTILEAIQIVRNASNRRTERDRLAAEARTKIFAQFPELREEDLEAKWKEVEELAQAFREAFHSGEDGYRNMRIIDLVWQGVENNKVNVDRDHEDNMEYTGGHLRFLQKMKIQPEQYEAKEAECKSFLAKATDKDWAFDKSIHEEARD